MRKLKYIYALLISLLLGFVSFACSDEELEQTEEENFTKGEEIKTTFRIGISAPDVTADLDGITRSDNANIEYGKTSNGGRFQNVIVVLVKVTTNKNGTKSESILKVRCKAWYSGGTCDAAGVKEHEEIFSDMNSTVGDVYKAYVFANVCKDHYDALSVKASSFDNSNFPIANWGDFVRYCRDASLSVDDVYNIDFTPNKAGYKIGETPVTSTGMPLNNSATATVVKGNTQLNVALKRVCARLQVTFRNFTGTYKDYDNSGIEKPNNVYVDKFEIKNVLANKANYFCDNTTPVDGVTSSNFDILKALGGSKTNDHIINKIENGKDLVVSMYVFENNKGGYQYDLKVDRGKSLGLNTTVIDTANAYVIWNNTKHNSIAYKGGKICASQEQTSKDNIPFRDQVFWKLENPICETKLAGEKVYMLRHFQINIDNDMYVDNEKVYLKQQTAPGSWLNYNYYDIDGTPADNNEEYQESYTEWWQTKYRTVHNDVQYIHFKLDNPNAKESKYTMNLMKTHDQENDYWEKAIGLFYRYNLLTVSDDGKLSKQRSEIQLSSRLGNYDWTLYAKYIIRKNEAVNFNKGEKGPISKIDRNHSYELDFSVMPNYDTKQELVVSCVRTQNEINWSEVEK